MLTYGGPWCNLRDLCEAIGQLLCQDDLVLSSRLRHGDVFAPNHSGSGCKDPVVHHTIQIVYFPGEERSARMLSVEEARGPICPGLILPTEASPSACCSSHSLTIVSSMLESWS